MDRIRSGALWALAAALAVSSALLSLVPPEAFGAVKPHGFELRLAQASTPAGMLTFTVNWTNPTQYTDGSALASTDINQTRIEYGTCTGGSPVLMGTVLGQFIATGGLQHAASPALAAGTYCARAYTTAKGVESVASSVVSVTLVAPPQPAPNPPSGVTATPVVQTADTNAYKLHQAVDSYQMVAFGSVPAGTACDPTHSIDGYSLIQRATVTLASRFDVAPLLAWAHCG